MYLQDIVLETFVESDSGDYELDRYGMNYARERS